MNNLIITLVVIAVLAFELHQARSERKSLALLIKSESVQEFVRAETQLAKPPEPDPIPLTPVDINDATEDPERVLKAMTGQDA